MKAIINSVLFLSTLLVTSSALAENHLKIHNHSGETIRAECGQNGNSGKSYSIQPSHSSTMKVHTHHDESHLNCRAINAHGRTLASRSFHFEEGQSYNWNVTNSEHNSH